MPTLVHGFAPSPAWLRTPARSRYVHRCQWWEAICSVLTDDNTQHDFFAFGPSDTSAESRVLREAAAFASRRGRTLDPL